MIDSLRRAGWDGKGPVDAPKMNVGDSWVFKAFYSEGKTDTFRRRVIFVASNGDFTMEVTTDKGDDVWQPRYDKDYRPQDKDVVHKLNFPLFVGKKWEKTFVGSAVGGTTHTYTNKYKVTKVKTIKTKAGKFKAFQIRTTIRLHEGGRSFTENYWYAPDVKVIVRSKPSWRYGAELLSYKLAGQP